ncbi:hypothetical protein [Amycolatopsis eburnea]|uniref:Uncharacterized protein n=1 Tax=Amycolatopsis eburnea TaxID=2267691 RepID=A0A3R9DRI6_9PSEU|nr:hypothetical protein [Amycolatopsis eburnea]RSD10289.1 hypothetical protein EIY87_35995 [Amycolatopsis eburnea]
MEDLVLTYGRWFTPSRLPIDRPTGSLQRCFANAARHSCEYDLFYVEGYATANSAAPFPHAWCSRPDGTVEDPTWNGDGTNYFGIPFTADFIRSRDLRRENGPLLFDQHLTGWQLLHGGIPDGAIAAVGQPHS